MLNDLTVTLTADALRQIGIRIPAELVEIVAKRVWVIGAADNMVKSDVAGIAWDIMREQRDQKYLTITHDVLTTLTALHALTHLDFEALTFWTNCCRCKTDRDIIVIPIGSLARLTPFCPACLEAIRSEWAAYRKEREDAEAQEKLKPRRRWFDPRGWWNHA